MPAFIRQSGVRRFSAPQPPSRVAGQGNFALEEVSFEISMTGEQAITFSITESLPVIELSGMGGGFVLSEPVPIFALQGAGPQSIALDLTEPLPEIALTGNKATVFSLTERLPTFAFSGGRAVVLSLTEPVPVLSLTGSQGDATVNGSFALSEQAPLIVLVSILSSDAVSTAVGLSDEARPLTDYDAWSVNVANKAHSGFTNYRFNSFFTFNGKDYGVSDDGVFELTGETDDSQPIPVKAIWGVTDLGTHYPKRFYRAFLTARDRGGYITLAAIMDEGERHTFTVDPSGRAGVHVIPIRLRRDMIGTEVSAEIANDNGGDIDVPGLEIQHQRLPRR